MNGPVALVGCLGRSGPRERASASDRRRNPAVRHRVLSALGDREPRPAGRLARIVRICHAGLLGLATAVTDVPATAELPRTPIDPAIVALVPPAAAGDTVAFTRLVQAFHADMARLAYFICGGNRELAEDAVQSAWTIAWSRLGTLRDPRRVRSWLLSVTANEARQLLRQQRQAVMVHLEFAEERLRAPDSLASPAALDMRAVLARLGPEERTLVGLRYAAGLDSSEIGVVLGMSASGVRSRLDRLLDRLRAELEHE
jgi:RNA polymerase sigma-70 factor, ECF subfamily